MGSGPFFGTIHITATLHTLKMSQIILMSKPLPYNRAKKTKKGSSSVFYTPTFVVLGIRNQNQIRIIYLQHNKYVVFKKNIMQKKDNNIFQLMEVSLKLMCSLRLGLG